MENIKTYHDVPVVGYDIVGFSSYSESFKDILVSKMQNILADSARFAIRHGSIWDKWPRHDLGDGYYIMLFGESPQVALKFVSCLIENVLSHNKNHGHDLKIYIRISIAFGDIKRINDSWRSDTLIQCSRFLDCKELRSYFSDLSKSADIGLAMTSEFNYRLKCDPARLQSELVVNDFGFRSFCFEDKSKITHSGYITSMKDLIPIFPSRQDKETKEQENLPDYIYHAYGCSPQERMRTIDDNWLHICDYSDQLIQNHSSWLEYISNWLNSDDEILSYFSSVILRNLASRSLLKPEGVIELLKSGLKKSDQIASSCCAAIYYLSGLPGENFQHSRYFLNSTVYNSVVADLIRLVKPNIDDELGIFSLSTIGKIGLKNKQDYVHKWCNLIFARIEPSKFINSPVFESLDVKRKLSEALLSPVAQVRFSAVIALCRLGGIDSYLTDYLEEVLFSNQATTWERLESCEYLASIGNDKAKDALLMALDLPDYKDLAFLAILSTGDFELIENTLTNLDSKHKEIKLSLSSKEYPKKTYMEISHKLRSDLLYLVNGHDRGRKAWYYIICESSKVNAFLTRAPGNQTNLGHFGTIVDSDYDDRRIPESSLFAT